jgi:hypothetical protein
VEIYIHLYRTLHQIAGTRESCIFRSCSWSGLINVYKSPLNNFHLQDPSTFIESSEMPTKSRYLPFTNLLLLNPTCLAIQASFDASFLRCRVVQSYLKHKLLTTSGRNWLCRWKMSWKRYQKIFNSFFARTECWKLRASGKVKIPAWKSLPVERFSSLSFWFRIEEEQSILQIFFMKISRRLKVGKVETPTKFHAQIFLQEFQPYFTFYTFFIRKIK